VPFHFCVLFQERMSSAATSNANASSVRSLILRVIDAQTSVENGRKCTKYKVSVNRNGQELEVWRRYNEFYTLNEKVSIVFSFD
jgi:hypothetical protein